MIPKIIHNAWFGRGEKSDLFKRCMDTWRKVHPDWQFVETNEDNLGTFGPCKYIRSVLERGEFVKATELARLAALWRQGGVYLDADVELVKPLDPLLEHTFFIGREDAEWLNGAVIGAEPGSEAVKWLISNFPVDSDGRAPANHYGPIYLTRTLAMLPPEDLDVTILSPEHFYPYLWNQKPEEMKVTDNTYAIHHWAKSWVEKPGETK